MGQNSKIHSDVERFRKLTIESHSISELYTKLGYKPSGGIYKCLRLAFKKYNIDTSHFTGMGWCKGKVRDTNSSVNNIGKKLEWKFDDIFCKNSLYRGHNQSIIRRLIREGIKTNKCEICGINEWMNKPIVIQLDHINGDNIDNRVENLRLLCPNCHSQTETFCKGLKMVS